MCGKRDKVGGQRVPVLSGTHHSRVCAAQGITWVPHDIWNLSTDIFLHPFPPFPPFSSLGTWVKSTMCPIFLFTMSSFPNSISHTLFYCSQRIKRGLCEQEKQKRVTWQRKGKYIAHIISLFANVKMSSSIISMFSTRSLKVQELRTKDHPWPLNSIPHHKTPKHTKTATCHISKLRFYVVKLIHLNTSCSHAIGFKKKVTKQKHLLVAFFCRCLEDYSWTVRALVQEYPKIVSWKLSSRLQECFKEGLLQILGLAWVESYRSSLRGAFRALVRVLIPPILRRWTVHP